MELNELGDEYRGAVVAARLAGPCSGVLIRAHLIPKQRIAREFPHGAYRTEAGAWRPVPRGTVDIRELGLTGEFLPLDGIVWDRRVWVPMCGGPMGNAGHHGMLDAGGVNRLRIERAWLPAAVEEFAVEFGLEWSLEADYGPKET